MMRIGFDFCVLASHPSLPGHFPDQPVVPGVVLLDHVMTHLQKVTGRRITQLQHVKFTALARPDEQNHVRCELTAARVSFRATTLRDGAVIELANGMLLLQGTDRSTQ